MFWFRWFKRTPRKRYFDRSTLRKNDISLLILDERWNSLFTTTEKTAEILKCEEKLRDLLKEQAALNTEAKEIARQKKLCMDRILQLTTEAFENNNEEARRQMQDCEKEIKRINKRLEEIDEAVEDMPDRIKEANLELLEHTVNVVYFKMRAEQERVKVLEALIEETKNKLKEYIEEKGTLSEDYTGIYSYFHDLLGGEELEKLDREFFKDDKKIKGGQNI